MWSCNVRSEAELARTTSCPFSFKVSSTCQCHSYCHGEDLKTITTLPQQWQLLCLGDGKWQVTPANFRCGISDNWWNGVTFFFPCQCMRQEQAHTHDPCQYGPPLKRKNMMWFIELIDNMLVVCGSFSHVLVDVFQHERNTVLLHCCIPFNTLSHYFICRNQMFRQNTNSFMLPLCTPSPSSPKTCTCFHPVSPGLSISLKPEKFFSYF